ncbi:hypothetical protein ciss_06150 [Carboxydothermus islandicus]|uniref:Uncharacterized protein n=1 Tax=Carboxydothermus islandicus TaxID=661089 RepID=A0A1L8D0J2_9THEO|nr:hypothetical protein [Carboxydothermus islandicus]GAV24682.1 hypothetical protein ciss_06150 [Carboxydothermus islandicus]
MRFKKVLLALLTIILLILTFNVEVLLGSSYNNVKVGQIETRTEDLTYSEVDEIVDNLLLIYFSRDIKLIDYAWKALTKITRVAFPSPTFILKDDVEKNLKFYSEIKREMKTKKYKKVILEVRYIYRTSRVGGDYVRAWYLLDQIPKVRAYLK